MAAHLTNRDHLEAIHEHLRYIYDRLDDLLDRVHYLETKDRNWKTKYKKKNLLNVLVIIFDREPWHTQSKK